MLVGRASNPYAIGVLQTTNDTEVMNIANYFLPLTDCCNRFSAA